MRKLNNEKLEELIKFESESKYIDFKAKQYSKNQNEELLKDMMSMVNSDVDGEKYIIIGVKSIPGKENIVLGIDENIKDDSEYQQLISNNIEPTINFSYLSDEIEGKRVAYFYIDSSNIDKPYMIKKDNNKLKQGDAFKRIGSSQRKLIRRDYDEIYKDNKKYLLIIEKIKSYKSEILLIENLKLENNYIIKKNKEISNMIDLYKKSTEPFKYFIRHILPENMSLGQWQYDSLKEIKSFSIKNLDDKLINSLLEKISVENSSKYINIITNIKDDYQYLHKLESELSELNKFDFRSEKNEIDNRIDLLKVREIYDDFSEIETYRLLDEINFDKRIKELKEKIKQLEIYKN
ncbi:MAG: ATP-binding protein [Romboutsia sp.]